MIYVNPGIVASGLKIVSRSLYPGEKEVILYAHTSGI